MKNSSTIYIIAFYDPRGLSTISEQISAWCSLSRFPVCVINLYKTFGKQGMRLPDVQVVSNAAAIIIHPTVCYSANNLCDLCESLAKVRNGRNFPIVLYKQDEHVQSHVTAGIIGKYDIDIVLTCTSEQDRSKVYPNEMVGDAIFEQVYTGYISEKLLKNAPRKSWNDRTIDFFYRGSKQPPEIGKLGFQKYSLARDLIAACERFDLRCDASSEWEDRILGFDWLLALSNSRATISLESGSNCFDFNGQLKIEVDKFLKLNSSLDPWSDDGFKILYDNILHEYEGNVYYGQIAPRHLEAVATNTAQLLLLGNYSGFFEAGQHYIELNPDLSNFNEAVELLNDDAYRQQMLERAYEEIALNPVLQYSNFIEKVDDLIEGCSSFLAGKSKRTINPKSNHVSATNKLQVVLMCPHQAHLDPRITWWAKHTSRDWDVHVIEIGKQVKHRGGNECHDGDVILSARDIGLTIRDLPNEVIKSGNVSSVIGILCCVKEQLDRVNFSKNLASLYSPDHLWLQDYLLRVSVGLIEAGIRVKGCDLLIVADLPALPAGVLFRELYGVPLIYDAQEIWSHSNLNLETHEIEWWNQLENKLIQDVDFPVTVSPGIGQWYQHEMDTEMLVVPNFSPLSDYTNKLANGSEIETIRFLYLGNFAENRGIEQLIEAWNFDPAIATLTLQGPNSEHRSKCKKLVKELGRGKKGVRFAPAVSESDLINEARKYHIGIIPYTYAYPYSHCSPNKLSQYMAAGCAIFSNKLPFVEQCISDVNCGVIANFNSPKKINDTIKKIIKDKKTINLWQNNSLQAVKLFNWEKASDLVVTRITEMHLKDRDNVTFAVDPPFNVNGARRFNRLNYQQIVRIVESRLQKNSILYNVARCGSRIIRKLF